MRINANPTVLLWHEVGTAGGTDLIPARQEFQLTENLRYRTEYEKFKAGLDFSDSQNPR